MILYLLRHGNTSASGGMDPPLSAEGRRMAGRAANLILSTGGRLESVFTSPLARAVETARMIARTAGGEVTAVDSLEPEGSEDETLHMLASCGAERVAAVGHLPQLRRMISALVSDSHPIGIHLDPGCAVCIEADFSTETWACAMLWAVGGELMRLMSFPAEQRGRGDGLKRDK